MRMNVTDYFDAVNEGDVLTGQPMHGRYQITLHLLVPQRLMRPPGCRLWCN